MQDSVWKEWNIEIVIVSFNFYAKALTTNEYCDGFNHTESYKWS